MWLLTLVQEVLDTVKHILASQSFYCHPVVNEDRGSLCGGSLRDRSLAFRSRLVGLIQDPDPAVVDELLEIDTEPKPVPPNTPGAVASISETALV